MKRILLILMLLSGSAWAAIDSTMVWEIRTTGFQTNGAGFKPGASGVDYSQQDAVQYALTSVTTVGVSAVMTDANAAADMVGNGCRVVSGTNATLNWYEIISVNVGTDITVDRNWTSGATSDSVVHIGGAFKLGGSLDNDFPSSFVAGNTCHMKSGTYTLSENVSTAIGSVVSGRIAFIGYNSSRGDTPTGTNRPLIQCGAFSWTFSNYNHGFNQQFTGTANDVVILAVAAKGNNIHANNNGVAIATRNAFRLTAAGATLVDCEAQSIRGDGVTMATNTSVINCYIHDCGDLGINNGSVGENCNVTGNIIETCKVGIAELSTNDEWTITGNTIQNCVTGIDGSGSTVGDGHTFVNNIIANCVTGADWNVVESTNLWDWNLWSDNDVDTVNVPKGDNAITSSALLAGTIVEGTDGVTDGAGTSFTAASNPFGSVTTADVLLITEAGTGATLDCYPITAIPDSGTLTLSYSAGASKTGIDYRIVLGNDFTPGTGSPALDAAVNAGTNTTATAGATDTGAIEAAAAAGSSTVFQSPSKSGGKQ